MDTVQKSLIDYEKPPLIEVVCGVLFNPISSFLAPHFGLLWEKYKPEYSSCREVAPLTPIIEKFEGAPEVKIEIGEIPPLPRIWFMSEKQNGLIQVQRDRFLHNWRKIHPTDEYPRYHTVIEKFQAYLSVFRTFLDNNDLGKLDLLQYEMTYVNHIPQGEGWEKNEDIRNLFPDFGLRSSNNRFLPTPEGMNWRTSFVLPNNAGRLHVTIRQVILREGNRPMILLELTARGIGEFKSSEKIWDWFNLARQWIVFGFVDLTSKEVQKKIWKRRDS